VCVPSGAVCWNDPLRRVYWAVDGLGEADVVCDLVDEARRPVETFVVSELGLYEYRIKRPSPVRQDGPCDPPADIRRN
jgi:hypothetical protein